MFSIILSVYIHFSGALQIFLTSVSISLLILLFNVRLFCPLLNDLQLFLSIYSLYIFIFHISLYDWYTILVAVTLRNLPQTLLISLAHIHKSQFIYLYIYIYCCCCCCCFHTSTCNSWLLGLWMRKVKASSHTGSLVLYLVWK